jgi:Ca2+-binding EF-hand superfamily protein
MSTRGCEGHAEVIMMKTVATTLLSAMLSAVPAEPSAAAGPTAGPPAGEIRDMLLLLDSGPLHLRIHVALEGRSLRQARDAYVERLIAGLDGDGDGSVSRKETQPSPLFNARRRFTDNPFLAQLDEDQTLSRREIEQEVERVGGETVAYRQDDSAAENDLGVFKLLDADGSGRIEPREMRTAAGRIADLDRDRDQCIDFGEFLPEPEPVANIAAVARPVDEEATRPEPTFATLLRDVREPLLPRRVVRMYDKNGDGRLSGGELGWNRERMQALDADRDGQLTSRELARLADSPVDLELAVELAGPAASGRARPALTVVSSAADRQAPAPRQDLVRLEFGNTQVTFSFRHLDPIESAVENAMRTFNQIDLDANGYIDRTEIAERYRFERYLFDAIDRDSDEKIFGDEMRGYVSVRAEPATTSCQVNVYDTGQGFFQMLDASGDGRISIRELRTIEERLAENAPAGQPLTPRDAGRHLHIEFVRGSYQLFGASERMAVQGPTFIQRPAVGPVWFQRMDRNSDGDLTWDEFLGPREVFHKLDADQDGLIDHVEAERAEEL